VAGVGNRSRRRSQQHGLAAETSPSRRPCRDSSATTFASLRRRRRPRPVLSTALPASLTIPGLRQTGDAGSGGNRRVPGRSRRAFFSQPEPTAPTESITTPVRRRRPHTGAGDGGSVDETTPNGTNANRPTVPLSSSTPMARGAAGSPGPAGRVRTRDDEGRGNRQRCRRSERLWPRLRQATAAASEGAVGGATRASLQSPRRVPVAVALTGLYGPTPSGICVLARAAAVSAMLGQTAEADPAQPWCARRQALSPAVGPAGYAETVVGPAPRPAHTPSLLAMQNDKRSGRGGLPVQHGVPAGLRNRPAVPAAALRQPVQLPIDVMHEPNDKEKLMQDSLSALDLGYQEPVDSLLRVPRPSTGEFFWLSDFLNSNQKRDWPVNCPLVAVDKTLDKNLVWTGEEVTIQSSDAEYRLNLATPSSSTEQHPGKQAEWLHRTARPGHLLFRRTSFSMQQLKRSAHSLRKTFLAAYAAWCKRRRRHLAAEDALHQGFRVSFEYNTKSWFAFTPMKLTAGRLPRWSSPFCDFLLTICVPGLVGLTGETTASAIWLATPLSIRRPPSQQTRVTSAAAVGGASEEVRRRQNRGNQGGGLHERRMRAIESLESARQEFLTSKRWIGHVRQDIDPQQRGGARNATAAKYHHFPHRWKRGTRLGEGGRGVAFTAVNLDNGVSMVVKKIDLSRAPESDLKDLIDEFEAVKRLSHDNIVQYYGIEVHRTEALLFMELCDAGDLHSASGQGLDLRMIRDYTGLLTKALAYIHEQKLTHRDVKSANVFLTSSPAKLKLGDFDCAQTCLRHRTRRYTENHPDLMGAADANSDTHQQQQQQQHYTPSRANPRRVPRRTAGDVWGLGCVVWQMLTGKPPWHDLPQEGAIYFKVGFLVQTEQVPLQDPSSRYPDQLFDREAQSFLMDCLRIDPRQRLTAAQLMNHTFVRTCDEFQLS
uniref:Protein kinase domain-containing protein n=1 Tax=Macrostomum lignano TaxID=282301 RepID=A0A1I8FEE4_9PLAT